MTLVARGRHVLARRPWLYWMFVIALAVTAACSSPTPRPRSMRPASVGDAPRHRRRRRRRARRSARRPDGDRDVPGPVVPASALSSLPWALSPRQRVAAGETVVDADVAATAGHGRWCPPAGRPSPSPKWCRAAVGDPVVAAAGGVVLPATASSSAAPATSCSSPSPPATPPQVAHRRRPASSACCWSPRPPTSQRQPVATMTRTATPRSTR